MKVSIVIINYNTFTLTSNCLHSVIANTRDIDYEIILVDNASSECDPGKFLEEFPAIKLVKSNTNAGFAAGNNLGIAASRGEYILLLNSDTILTEDSISKSVNFLQKKPGTAVMGCRMVFPDGKIQHTARRFRSISWELLDLFRFIPYLMPYSKRSKRMLGKYFRHDEDMECDWLNGAFFLFRKVILDQLPGNKLDDRFFMYGEDQLWCEQFRKLGYSSNFYAGSTIIHINSGSTGISRQLALRKIMMKHELQLMKDRKGAGLYYLFFKMVYVMKEGGSNFVKAIYYRVSGKMIR